MKLLLDTHVALWFHLGDPSLAPAACALICDSDNKKYVSLASLWEIATKNNLGRRSTGMIGIPVMLLITEFRAQNFSLLPLEPRHLEQVERLPHLHRDPFDRLLIAQAFVDELTLLTHDDKLAPYGEHVMLV